MSDQGGSDLKKIEQIVKQNLSLTREILESVEKTRKYIFWLRIFSIVKLVVIILPIVLAIIFLPPLLSQVFHQYTDVFGQIQQLRGGNVGEVDPNIIRSILGQ